MPDDLTARKTLTVPQAGELYFGLGRAAAYAAAARGDLPTIRIGRVLRVPIVLMEKMLLEPQKASAGK